MIYFQFCAYSLVLGLSTGFTFWPGDYDESTKSFPTLGCHDYAMQENFDPEKAQGVWFEVMRRFTNNDESFCNKMLVYKEDRNSTQLYFRSQDSNQNGSHEETSGTFRFDAVEPARMNVILDTGEEFPLLVLSYEFSHLIVEFCEENDEGQIVVFTRLRDPSEDEMAVVRRALQERGMNPMDFELTDQDDCKFSSWKFSENATRRRTES